MQAFGDDVIGPGGKVLPFSSALRVSGLILLSGQVALRDGAIVGSTIEEQTNFILDNIAGLLESQGKSLADVTKVMVWLVRPEDFAGFNATYGARFTKPYPVRSAVVSQLLIPGALVEIEVTVAAG